MSEEAGMRQTSAMIREEQQGGMQGQTGMQQRGGMGQMERGGISGEQMRGSETGTTSRTTRGRGEKESEEAGMQQMSLMIREEREEGNP